MQKRFDPRKPEDRQLTDERVSTFLNSVKQMVPSACVLLSIEHGIDDTLPLNMIEKAAEFMANKNVKKTQLKKSQHCWMHGFVAAVLLIMPVLGMTILLKRRN